jgi:hypothetical protein
MLACPAGHRIAYELWLTAGVMLAPKHDARMLRFVGAFLWELNSLVHLVCDLPCAAHGQQSKCTAELVDCPARKLCNSCQHR